MDSVNKLSGKTLKIQPEDTNEPIDVAEEVTDMAGSIKEMIADFGTDAVVDIIPIKVKHDIFRHIETFCIYFIQNPPPKEEGDKKCLELRKWDLDFCTTLDQKTLFAVILAANYLDIKPLLDVTCLHIALKLKSMTPEEIRKEYNITKVFTPEEEEKARKEFEAMIVQSVTTKK